MYRFPWCRFGKSRPSRPGVRRLRLELLEDRSLLSSGPLAESLPLPAIPAERMSTATAIAATSHTSGSLTAAGDVFQFQLSQPGLLTARVTADGNAARLSLFGAAGQLLAQSDGTSPQDLDDFIAQHLSGQA